MNTAHTHTHTHTHTRMHTHTHVHVCISAYANTAEELVDIAVILFYIYTYIGGVGYQWWVFRSTVVGSYALLGTVPLKFSQKHCLVLTHSLSLSLSDIKSCPVCA